MSRAGELLIGCKSSLHKDNDPSWERKPTLQGYPVSVLGYVVPPPHIHKNSKEKKVHCYRNTLLANVKHS